MKFDELALIESHLSKNQEANSCNFVKPHVLKRPASVAVSVTGARLTDAFDQFHCSVFPHRMRTEQAHRNKILSLDDPQAFIALDSWESTQDVRQRLYEIGNDPQPRHVDPSATSPEFTAFLKFVLAILSTIPLS